MSRPFEKSKALLREVKQGKKTSNQHEQYRSCGRDGKDSETTMMAMMKEQGRRKDYQSGMWIPHPTTGIYYPKGHEWVMEDIPKGAASFEQTYWLRNSEGTDKPSSDYSNNTPIFDHPFL